MDLHSAKFISQRYWMAVCSSLPSDWRTSSQCRTSCSTLKTTAFLTLPTPVVVAKNTQEAQAEPDFFETIPATWLMRSHENLFSAARGFSYLPVGYLACPPSDP